MSEQKKKQGGISRLDLRPSRLNRTIADLAVPAIVANVLYTLVFIVDTFIVARLESEVYLAAAGLSSLIMIWSNASIQGIAIGATSLVSRTLGEKDHRLARQIASHCLLLTFLIVGTIIMLGIPLAPQIIRLFQAEPDVVPVAVRYLRLVLLSSILGMPLLISNTIMRAKGDTRTPMWITGGMNLVNIVISYVLAFGVGPFPRMEIYGVAWGTVIARNLGGLAGLWLLFSERLGLALRISDFAHISMRLFSRIWYVSLPALAEQVIGTTSYAVFMGMVTRLGTTVLAAHQIALNVESLAFMPALGASIATTTIIGQAAGAGRHRVAEIAIKRTLIATISCMALLGILFALFAPQAIQPFTATPEVLQLAGLALQIAGLELPMFALVFIFSGALRGAGDTKSPMFINMACTVLLRLPATYLMGFVWGWGIAGVWLATVLDWSGRSLGLWLIFRKGGWKQMHKNEKKKFR